jgi:hypothetical protein
MLSVNVGQKILDCLGSLVLEKFDFHIAKISADHNDWILRQAGTSQQCHPRSKNQSEFRHESLLRQVFTIPKEHQ